MVINISRLIVLFVVCSIASFTDLTQGKIENRLVEYASIIGALFDIIQYGIMNQKNMLLFLENAGIVFIIAIVLYLTHIWAGGDSKLLCVIALLFPAEWYWSYIDLNFPFVYSIFLMFSLGFVYLFGESLVLEIKNKLSGFNKITVKNILRNIIQYGKTLLVIAALGHIYVSCFSHLFYIPNIIFTCFCIIVIWWMNSQKLMNSKVLMIVILVFDIAMIFLTGIITINRLWWTYAVAVAFICLRILINQFNYTIIETETVKKGMVLSLESSVLFQNSRVKGLPGISDETLKSRITQEQAESIKRWKRSKNGCENIIIVRKIPFAIFMLMGIMLYCLVGGRMA